MTASFLTLIATNILTLTHSAFNVAVSGLMSTAFGIQTVSEIFRSKLDAKSKTIASQKSRVLFRQQATKRFGRKVTARTRKLVATTVAELPAEAIPMLGITVLLAATAYEIKMACNNLDDLSELYRDLGIEEEVDSGVLDDVCHPTLPSIEDLKISVDGYLG